MRTGSRRRGRLVAGVAASAALALSGCSADPTPPTVHEILGAGVGPDGTVYLLDRVEGNSVVVSVTDDTQRQVFAGGGRAWMVETGGPAPSARFSAAAEISVDDSGWVSVADCAAGQLWTVTDARVRRDDGALPQCPLAVAANPGGGLLRLLPDGSVVGAGAGDDDTEQVLPPSDQAFDLLAADAGSGSVYVASSRTGALVIRAGDGTIERTALSTEGGTITSLAGARGNLVAVAGTQADRHLLVRYPDGRTRTADQVEPSSTVVVDQNGDLLIVDGVHRALYGSQDPELSHPVRRMIDLR